MEPLLGFTGREGTLEKRLKGKNQPAWCCSSAAPSWWKTNKAPQGAQENSWISRSCYQHFAGNHLAADVSHFKGIPWSCTVPIESKIYFPCVSVNMGIKRDNCGTKRKWGSLLWHSGALCRAQPMLTEPQSAQQDYPSALLPSAIPSVLQDTPLSWPWLPTDPALLWGQDLQQKELRDSCRLGLWLMPVLWVCTSGGCRKGTVLTWSLFCWTEVKQSSSQN